MIINVWTSSVDLNLDDHKRPRKPLLWQLGRQGVPKIGCFRKVVVVFPGAVVNKRRSPHVFYQFLNMLICPGKGRFLAVCHLDKTDVIFSYKRVGSAARQPQKIRSQRQSNAVAAAAPRGCRNMDTLTIFSYWCDFRDVTPCGRRAVAAWKLPLMDTRLKRQLPSEFQARLLNLEYSLNIQF